MAQEVRLKEGLAEFIHGADSRVYGILGNDPSDDKIRELINAIGTGNEFGQLMINMLLLI